MAPRDSSPGSERRSAQRSDVPYRTAPHVPILVINSPDDEDAATQAVTRGAQDFLRRDRLDGYTLRRALKRIIERKAADARKLHVRPACVRSAR